MPAVRARAGHLCPVMLGKITGRGEAGISCCLTYQEGMGRLFWLERSKIFPLKLESREEERSTKMTTAVENGSSWNCSFVPKWHLVSLVWMLLLPSHSFISQQPKTCTSMLFKGILGSGVLPVFPSFHPRPDLARLCHCPNPELAALPSFPAAKTPRWKSPD